MGINKVGTDAFLAPEKSNTKTKVDKAIKPVAIFLACFILSFMAGSLIIHPQGTKAVAGLTLVQSQTMTLSSSTNNLELTLTPTPSGTLASSQHNLTATTNVPTGYNLNLSLTQASTLPVTTGTIASPTALTNNTWGFATTRATTSTPSNTITNNFDSAYVTPTPATASKWANPTNTTFKNTTNSTTNDTTTIYYGAKADLTQPAGTYTNTIRYTATANTTTLPHPTIITTTPSSGTTAGGTAIQIAGTGFTANNESITTAVTIDGQNCSNVTISSNTPSTGQDTIYCTVPAHAIGAVNVVVTTWGGTITSTNGYTYVTPANVTFVSPNQASTIPGTESGPAITIAGTNFTTGGTVTSVTIAGTACTSFQVISDTQIFCKAPNTITTTGNKAIAVNKTVGTGTTQSTGTINITYDNTAYPTFADTNAFTTCSTTPQLFRDTRDSQLYYVKKMPDQKCWMVDNLKYANYGTLSQENGKYLTVDGTATQSTANSDIAKYVDPGAANYCTGTTSMPANTNTKCGLLYNWYAATNGTGTYAQSTQGTNVTGNICPANFRLPSGMSDGSTATGNGTSYNAADLAVLSASMNAGTLSPGNTSNYYTNWQPAGAWGGTFSGLWGSALSNMGSGGDFWSSTVDSTGRARALGFNSSGVNPGINAGSGVYLGFTVRCVMEYPGPTPPSGIAQANITTTNPAVIDVYPTTGWEGDTIAITSNGRFPAASSIVYVTVGGTECTEWGVFSNSLITCTLPPKASGTANAVSVTLRFSYNDIIDTTTYTHMKVTYFDPSQSTVNIGGTTYNYYANGFTSANCSAMTPSNAAIGTEPAASLAYVRDPRNKQTYRVKKMVDNKCWMVDNLKYIDTTIANVDGTAGMVFNNGDHLNNGGTTALNTVDESITQSTANSDKAFYDNPMSSSYCYGTTNMPTNSLTRCGYQYNWYAATNGTGTYAQSTEGTNVTGNICPANFRLPSGMSNGSTPTSNGTSYAAADFAVLNASMNTGSLATGNTSVDYYANWQPSGAWGGTFSGYRSNALYSMGSVGYFWSSTVRSAAGARNLGFYSSYVYPGNDSYGKYYGFTVRCVLP